MVTRTGARRDAWVEPGWWLARERRYHLCDREPVQQTGGQMGRRVDDLAEQLEAISREVIVFCEGLSDADWGTVVPNEERTVGVLMQHIAVAYGAEMALIRAIVNDQPLPAIYDDRAILDEANARDAVELLPGTKAEALAMLDEHCRAAAEFLRTLDDDDLAKARPLGMLGGTTLTVEKIIRRIVLGHPGWHLKNIRETLAGAAPLEPA
jgi:hypothetical protein